METQSLPRKRTVYKLHLLIFSGKVISRALTSQYQEGAKMGMGSSRVEGLKTKREETKGRGIPRCLIQADCAGKGTNICCHHLDFICVHYEMLVIIFIMMTAAAHRSPLPIQSNSLTLKLSCPPFPSLQLRFFRLHGIFKLPSPHSLVQMHLEGRSGPPSDPWVGDPSWRPSKNNRA